MPPDLEATCQEIDAEFSGRWVLYAEHLASGEVFRWGETRPMETASSIKLVVLAAALDAVAKGAWSLADLIAVAADDWVEGSGVLQHCTVGTRLSLKDLLTLMIIVSDNVATNTVLRLIGLESVNALAEREGLSQTRIVKRIDFDRPGPIGLSTPGDLARLLTRIHRRQLITAEMSALMWDILIRQQYNTLITRTLPYALLNGDPEPAPVTVGSKSGSLSGVRNDAGLVVTPWGDYVIAIMSEGCRDLRFHPDNEAMVVLPRASRAVFDHFIPERGRQSSR